MACEIVCTAADPRWLELRRLGIGASEIPVVLGLRAGIVDLWLDKTGRKPRAPLNGEWIEWGHRLESPIIDAFSNRTGRKVRRSGTLLRSTAHPWALATLDAWCEVDGEEWPLEIKNVGTHRASTWEDGAPADYVAQVHQQMIVTGHSRATIAALIGGQRLVWQDIFLDDQLARRIVACGDEFWSVNVCGEHPPDLSQDDPEAVKRALEALYPKDISKQTIVLPAGLEDHYDKLVRIKAAIAELDKERTRLENDVRAAMGDAQRGVLCDGSRRSFTWKQQHRAGCVIPPSTFRVLRMHEPKEES